MNPSITERLSRIRVFQTLDNNALEHIAPFFVHHAFVRGQCILTHGERSTAVYFLTEGRVRATMYSPTGREVSYQDLKPGEMFGELAALDQLPRSMHVIGLTAGECLIIAREDFMRLLAEHSGFAQAVLLKMAGLVRFLCDRLYEYATLSVAERLRAELIRLAHQENHNGSEPIVIRNMPTHEELANRLATHREAITRELGALEKNGIVRKQRNAVTILNMRALQSLA